jgi:diadenosine tetraphosphate (Ap4A) HIT family hydrolase
MSTDHSCIFCRIVVGEAAASLVYQDDLVTAFMDILPVNPGHLLIVPNEHSPGLSGLDEAAGQRLFGVAARLGGALRQSGLRCEGVNLYLADGRAAGQEVFHVHMHVLPRYEGDGFGLRRTKHLGRPSRAELDLVAEHVRGALEAGQSGS